MRKMPHVKSLLSLLRGKRRVDPETVAVDGLPNIAEHVPDAGYYQEVSFRYSCVSGGVAHDQRVALVGGQSDLFRQGHDQFDLPAGIGGQGYDGVFGR